MSQVPDSEIWNQFREEAASDAQREPALASFLDTVVVNHRCPESALSYILASTLGSPTVTALTLRDFMAAVFASDAAIGAAIRADLEPVVTRVSAWRSASRAARTSSGL